MKKICGFKSKDGILYETEEKCKEADLNYEIKKVKNTLYNFESKIIQDILEYSLIHEEDYHKVDRLKNDILNIVAKNILKDSDKFIEVINSKKVLESKLNEMYAKRHYNKHENNLIISNWWLKLKWW